MALPRRPALLGLILLTTWLLSVPTTAWAATGDTVDVLRARYVVTEDGLLHVRETVLLRFGENSKRQGLERWLITRAPFDTDHDALFTYSHIEVTSPSGAPTDLAIHPVEGEGRERLTRMRVGDPTRIIFEPTATYHISYTVSGALRPAGTMHELVWDVTGRGFPAVRSAQFAVAVPHDASAVSCRAGWPGGRVPCPTSTINEGQAEFGVRDIAFGSPIGVSVRFPSDGLSAGGSPQLVTNADSLERRSNLSTLILAAACALIVPLAGWWYYTRHRVDRRFAGLAAGVVPAEGESVAEIRDTGRTVPPIATPPSLPLAEAGLLLDGQPGPRQASATLVALAVDGAIRLNVAQDPRAYLIDARKARDRPSAALLAELFDGVEPSADLTSNVALAEASDATTAAAAAQADDQGWFLRQTSGGAAGTLVIATAALGYVAYLMVGDDAFYFAPTLVSIAATGAVLLRMMRRGQRSATGRALTDQVEGFRRFLATAEPSGLTGDDTFSRYLPWAVLFDLTGRWARIGKRLAEEGRAPTGAPAWLEGGAWTPEALASHLEGINRRIELATSSGALSGRQSFRRGADG